MNRAELQALLDGDCGVQGSATNVSKIIFFLLSATSGQATHENLLNGSGMVSLYIGLIV